MAGLSDYLEDKIVNHILGKASYTMPATVYVALFTVAPADSGGGTEIVGGGYARVAITTAMSTSSGGAGLSTNSSPIAFPTPSSAWGTIVATALFDALTGGNMLLWNNLVTPRAVGAGDAIQYNTGKLNVSGD